MNQTEENLQEAAGMQFKSPRTYKDAINALNTLQSNFASIEALKKLGDNVDRHRLSIDEMYEYTRRLGYQSSDFNKLNIIHVTGTKGKGSTCAFTESIIRQYGVGKVGLYTSPHLKMVRERIRINGEPIDQSKFTNYFFEVWDKLSSTTSSATKFPTLQPSEVVKPMYFKYLTLLSFHVFMSEGVNTAIYEVGVGGTYDSTNIIEKPTVTGIASLGIDHVAMLGSTIESITLNKTGIFKNGVPAVVSQQTEHPETIEIIEQRAKELGSSSLEIVSPDTIPEDVELGISGQFQRRNAALAVKLASIHLKHLGETDLPKGKTLPERFLKGLRNTKWDGRCQIIRNKSKFENIVWYVDGAHTLESIVVSSEWFKTKVSNLNTTRVLLFNQQKRENAGELLEKLYESVITSNFQFDHVIFTTNVTWSNGSYNPDLVSINNSKEAVEKLVVQKELAEKWNTLEKKDGISTRKHTFPDIETSLNFIKSLSGNSSVEVFVCGSLHLLGGVLVVLEGDKD